MKNKDKNRYHMGPLKCFKASILRACRQRVGLAEAQTDEDSVTGGSESIIRLPERLAEKRGVERGKKKKKRKWTGGGSGGRKSKVFAGEDTDTNLLTRAIMIIRPRTPVCALMEIEPRSKKGYPPFEIIDSCSEKNNCCHCESAAADQLLSHL